MPPIKHFKLIKGYPGCYWEIGDIATNEIFINWPEFWEPVYEKQSCTLCNYKPSETEQSLCDNCKNKLKEVLLGFIRKINA